MRKTLAVAVLCLGLLGFAEQTFAAAPTTTASVIAHRGASQTAPENTLTALRRAIRAGSDVVEVDVRLTADRELVLMHDASLRRTTDVEEHFPQRYPWRVRDFTLEEIRRLDAGSWKDPAFAGEPVPTLADALATVGGRVTVLVDLKQPAREDDMEAAVARHLTADGTATGPPRQGQDVVVQSFDSLAMARFSRLQPGIPVGVLTRRAPTAAELSIYADFAVHVGPPHGAVDRALVTTIQQAGLRITPYTVNDRAGMRQLLRWGVDGIVSDRPALLRRVRDALIDG